eukprot:TRINITY_DN1416_c0_g1_i2.p1 TRINITY_DN1416_c0_g1~~TRINITY_DN1416_c0_g1_i2.p1  ORF type:complete len:224 (-),score=53.18 TRINITY_DN1416_c0_g1_i2:121-753(-)
MTTPQEQEDLELYGYLSELEFEFAEADAFLSQCTKKGGRCDTEQDNTLLAGAKLFSPKEMVTLMDCIQKTNDPSQCNSEFEDMNNKTIERLNKYSQVNTELFSKIEANPEAAAISQRMQNAGKESPFLSWKLMNLILPLKSEFSDIEKCVKQSKLSSIPVEDLTLDDIGGECEVETTKFLASLARCEIERFKSADIDVNLHKEISFGKQM